LIHTRLAIDPRLVPIMIFSLRCFMLGCLVASTHSQKTSLRGRPVVVPDKYECNMWDEVMTTFHGAVRHFYEAGDYWIVKSPTVGIQGRYANPKSKGLAATLKEMAMVAKPDGHRIKVGSMRGDIRCEGDTILEEFGETFCGNVRIVYNAEGALINPYHIVPEKHRIVHIYLSEGVEVQINRWSDFINSKITVPNHAVNGHGMCGNLWDVSRDELLFSTSSAEN